MRRLLMTTAACASKSGAGVSPRSGECCSGNVKPRRKRNCGRVEAVADHHPCNSLLRMRLRRRRCIRRRRRPKSGFVLEGERPRMRNAATFPSLTVMSSFVTSATRRSRSDPAAVSTALPTRVLPISGWCFQPVARVIRQAGWTGTVLNEMRGETGGSLCFVGAVDAGGAGGLSYPGEAGAAQGDLGAAAGGGGAVGGVRVLPLGLHNEQQSQKGMPPR